MAPLSTNLPGINSVGVNPVHGLIGLGGENGVMEFWDPRDKTRVSSVDLVQTALAADRMLGECVSVCLCVCVCVCDVRCVRECEEG